jgi:putative DNA primase/helicase
MPVAATPLEHQARILWASHYPRDKVAPVLKARFIPDCVNEVLDGLYAVEPPPLPEPPDDKAPREFALTDFGNAERLVHYHGDGIRHCSQHGRWYLWDNARWRADDTGGVLRCAKGTVRRIFAEGERLKPSEGDTREARKLIEGKREQIARHALRSESDNALLAMVRLAESEASVAVRAADLDVDPFAFNVANGTIDLRSGTIRPHLKTDMFSKVSPVWYDPTAIAPRWADFLDRILDGDLDMFAFVQKAAGYSLTADVSEQVLFFLYVACRALWQ